MSKPTFSARMCSSLRSPHKRRTSEDHRIIIILYMSTHSKFSKLVAGLVGLSTAFMMIGTASVAEAAALTQSQISAIVSLLQSFGADAQTIANVQASLTGGTSTGGSTTTTTGTCAYTFATNLKQGMTSTDVMNLQKVLNMNAVTQVAATGVGSAGNESTYFGAKTKAAVVKFQELYAADILTPVGLTAGNGYVGASTRAKLNAVCSGSTTTTTTTGAVTAALAATNPASTVLVSSQATAKLLDVAFSGNSTVTSVTIKRTGVSADSTLSNVYLFDGAQRLTDAAAVSNNGIVTFNIPAGIFTVAGTKTISVKSDIAANTAGQSVGVTLTGYTVGGTAVTANVAGNIHSIAFASNLAAVSASTVTPSGATINPAANVTLWQSTLTVSNRDVLMKRIAFRNIGSAPASAFQNFKLYMNGTQVGTAAGLDANGYVTFDLSASPVTLASGAHVVRVDADVVSGASRTVQLSLRQAADIDFVDSSYGVNIAPTLTPWTPSSASTIAGSSGGSLTIEKDTSSPSTNLVLSGNDVNLGVFKLTAYGEPIKIETLSIGGTFNGTLGSTSDAAVTLRNGRILLAGTQYGSTATLAPAGTSFTTNYTINPGTPVLLEVHADVYDNDGTGALDASDTIQITVKAGSSNAMRVDSLGSFNAPASDVPGNTLTIGSTTMTLTKNATYANQTTVLPNANFKIGAWNLTGSSIQDILLNTLSFDVDEVTNTTFNESDMTNMYAVVKVGDATVVSTSPLATVSAADNNFSINYTLAKNTNAQIELYANLSGTVTVGDSFLTDLVVSGTSMTSGSSVTTDSDTSSDTGDIDGQTITYGAGSITATLDASSPVAAIVADNQTVTSAAYKFAAVTSAYNVTNLTFTVPPAAATVVSTVELYDGTSSLTPFASAVGGTTTVNFTGLSWNVPANTNKVLTVKLVLTGIGINAGTSSAALTTTLTDFTATSVSTGVSAPCIESDPAGAVHYAYAAIPQIDKVSFTSTKALKNGENDLVRFTVTPVGGTIEWTRLLFKVTKTSSPVLTNATLWDVTGGSNVKIVGTDTLTTVGAGNTSGTIEFDATSVQSLSSAKTYELRITASAVGVDVDSVVTKLAQNTIYAVPKTAALVETTNPDTTIIWSDVSASSHATTTSDWSGDYGVKSLPISQTISS